MLCGFCHIKNYNTAFIFFFFVFVLLKKKRLIYLREGKRVDVCAHMRTRRGREWSRERERENQADSLRSVEPGRGLDLMTRRS